MIRRGNHRIEQYHDYLFIIYMTKLRLPTPPQRKRLGTSRDDVLNACLKLYYDSSQLNVSRFFTVFLFKRSAILFVLGKSLIVLQYS